MTYQELLDQLKDLTPEQLESKAAYHCDSTGMLLSVYGVNPNGETYGLLSSMPIMEVEQ